MHPSLGPGPVVSLLTLRLYTLASTFLACALACSNIQDAPAGLLYGGGCYSITSAYSTPALTVSTTTWAGAASAARPVLDACNQVQQVWLQPGTLEQGGGLERES